MFDSIENNSKSSFVNEIPFVDKYPCFQIDIENAEIEDINGEGNLCWLSDTHKKVNINNGEFVAVIHKGMAGLVKVGYRTIWFVDRDPHKRFLEIVLIQK